MLLSAACHRGVTKDKARDCMTGTGVFIPNSQIFPYESLCVHQPLFQSLCPSLLCKEALEQHGRTCQAVVTSEDTARSPRSSR